MISRSAYIQGSKKRLIFACTSFDTLDQYYSHLPHFRICSPRNTLFLNAVGCSTISDWQENPMPWKSSSGKRFNTQIRHIHDFCRVFDLKLEVLLRCTFDGPGSKLASRTEHWRSDYPCKGYTESPCLANKASIRTIRKRVKLHSVEINISSERNNSKFTVTTRDVRWYIQKKDTSLTVISANTWR